jgi:hypothetical protein
MSMPNVDRKTEIAALDATPEKRSFWSIISDYDLKTGVCELVDNAIDIWTISHRKNPLHVEIKLDLPRQLLSITDNAGGVRFEDLRLLVAPGGSKNSPQDSTIGVFGVGSKRAVIALGEVVSLKTHHHGDRSFQIDITKEWLESPSWELAAYEIPPIEPGITTVELGALRRGIAEQDVESLRTHIGEVYSHFLGENCTINVNEKQIIPVRFDVWAYPPDYSPQRAVFSVSPDGQRRTQVIITAGLIRDRIPEAGNYGVYFYCNNRMIVKELKTRDVGYYVGTEAGVPHPDASLCRVIVELKGPAILMPWTSNKTNINSDHVSFLQIRPTITQLVTQFTKVSRAFKGDWDNRVIRFTTGKIIAIDNKEISPRGKLVLPPTPRVNKSHAEFLKAKNRRRIERQPWTLGIVEAMAAVDIIVRQRLETRNRIALLLLDSNFEIGLKEFIVHNPTMFPSVNLKQLFENRDNVIKSVAQKVTMESELTGKAKHYYDIRNKLIHERATIDVPDSDIENYAKTIKRFLKLLFGLQFD